MSHAWLVLGFAGQALFTSRFLVQWLSSERAKQSVMPVSFWYLSLAGGLALLAYALHRADPVFILGQATGILVYSRNLQLLRRSHRADGGEATTSEAHRGEASSMPAR